MWENALNQACPIHGPWATCGPGTLVMCLHKIIKYIKIKGTLLFIYIYYIILCVAQVNSSSLNVTQVSQKVGEPYFKCYNSIFPPFNSIMSSSQTLNDQVPAFFSRQGFSKVLFRVEGKWLAQCHPDGFAPEVGTRTQSLLVFSLMS